MRVLTFTLLLVFTTFLSQGLVKAQDNKFVGAWQDDVNRKGTTLEIKDDNTCAFVSNHEKETYAKGTWKAVGDRIVIVIKGSSIMYEYKEVKGLGLTKSHASIGLYRNSRACSTNQGYCFFRDKD